MYAVVETGGKQYKVAVGDTVDVERLAHQVGDSVVLDRVLMVSDGGNVRVGQPILEGATVSATVVRQDRGPKVLSYHYSPKKRFRRLVGHRQEFTRLRIDGIQS